MTRKRYIKLRMAEGLSRNEATLRAKKIVAEGLSYQEGYNCDATIRALTGAIDFGSLSAVLAGAAEAIGRMARAICKATAAFSEVLAKELHGEEEEGGSHGNT